MHVAIGSYDVFQKCESLIFSRLPADNELRASSSKFGDKSNEISNPFPPNTKFLKVVYLFALPHSPAAHDHFFGNVIIKGSGSELKE